MDDGCLERLEHGEEVLPALGIGELDRAREHVHVLIGLTGLATALLIGLHDEQRGMSSHERALALDDLGPAHVGPELEPLPCERLKCGVNGIDDRRLLRDFHEDVPPEWNLRPGATIYETKLCHFSIGIHYDIEESSFRKEQI